MGLKVATWLAPPVPHLRMYEGWGKDFWRTVAGEGERLNGSGERDRESTLEHLPTISCGRNVQSVHNLVFNGAPEILFIQSVNFPLLLLLLVVVNTTMQWISATDSFSFIFYSCSQSIELVWSVVLVHLDKERKVEFDMMDRKVETCLSGFESPWGEVGVVWGIPKSLGFQTEPGVFSINPASAMNTSFSSFSFQVLSKELRKGRITGRHVQSWVCLQRSCIARCRKLPLWSKHCQNLHL